MSLSRRTLSINSRLKSVVPGLVLVGLISVIAFGQLGCSSSDSPSDPGGGDTSSFQAVIDGAGDYQNPTPTRVDGEPTSFTQETNPREDGTSWTCRTRVVDMATAPQEFVLFSQQATGTSVYPGALLQGNDESLQLDPPDRIPLDRGGGTVVIDLFTGEDQPTDVTVDEVTAASITGAVNELVGTRTLKPDRFTYESTRVEAAEELRLAMNLKYDTWVTSVDASFKFGSDTSSERWLIKLVQPFYTINFQPPNDPAEWFAPGVTSADLARYAGEDNPPVYVSSVTYGRLVYLLLESTLTRTEIESAIEFSKGAVDGTATGSWFSELEETTITAMVYGGEFDIGVLQGSFGDVQAALSAEQPIQKGLAISYTMNDLKNGRSVRVKNLAEGFTVNECVPYVGATFDFKPAQDLGLAFADDKVVGDFNGDGRDDLLFSRDAGGQVTWEYATSDGEGGFSPVTGTPFSLREVGAVSAHPADLDGDGYDDVFWQQQQPGVTGWLYQAENTSGNFAANAVRSGKYQGRFCGENYTNGFWGQFTMQVGRFNRDDRDALMWNLLVYWGQNAVQITDENLFNCSGEDGMFAPFWCCIGAYDSEGWNNHTALVGDLNGDGLDDLALPRADGSNLWLNHTVSRERGADDYYDIHSDWYVPSDRTSDTWEYGCGDVNGDGIDDVLYLEASQSPPLLAVAQGNSRDDVGADRPVGVLRYDNIQGGPFTIALANFDSDREQEVILIPNDDRSELWVLNDFDSSTGKFGSVGRVRHPNPDLRSASDWEAYDVRVMNVNGDQTDDLVWVNDEGSIYVGVAERN